IVLLKKEDIVKSLSEALNLVKKENEILPTNILFIAGPSRTADIELITVFGVHGPQIAHIIIY
ncbi:LUD domain-containing protein, partial [Campylobacter coli]